MLTLIFRSLIIYLIVLVLFRLMGKRQLGQMQPFELVLTLIIADLATIPMGDISIPVLHGIVPLLTLVIIHFILSFLSKVSFKLAIIISGTPIIVINPDGIDYKAIKKLNISVDDLFESIRAKGFFNLEQIHYAIMETNGTMNVLPKAEFAPATNGDLGKKVSDAPLPVTIISEGTFLKQNAELANVSKDMVLKILNNQKIKRFSDCLIFTINKSGQIYLQPKNGKYKIITGPEGLGI